MREMFELCHLWHKSVNTKSSDTSRREIIKRKLFQYIQHLLGMRDLRTISVFQLQSEVHERHWPKRLIGIAALSGRQAIPVIDLLLWRKSFPLWEKREFISIGESTRILTLPFMTSNWVIYFIFNTNSRLNVLVQFCNFFELNGKKKLWLFQ